MKSMILKDIYNITHNMRSLGLLLVMFVFIMLPQGGAPSYITTSCVLCSMMVITTFSFDNMSKWEKYALVMPVTKQDLVAAKFIVLLIFTAFGAVSGLVLGIIGGLILGSFHPADPTEWLTTAAVADVYKRQSWRKRTPNGCCRRERNSMKLRITGSSPHRRGRRLNREELYP